MSQLLTTPPVESSSVSAEVSRKPRFQWATLGLPERKALLFLIDLGILNGALAISLNQRSLLKLTQASLLDNAAYFLLISLIWVVFSILLGIYNLLTAASPMRSAWMASVAGSFTILLFSVIPYLSTPLPQSRLSILFFPALTIATLALWRTFYGLILAQSTFSQRILIIGAGWSGQTLARVLHGGLEEHQEASFDKHIGYQVLGFVDDDPEKLGQDIEGASVLIAHTGLVSLVQRYRPDQVVICITAPQNLRPELFDAILEVRKLGVPITTMASLYEKVTGRVPVEHVGHNLSAIFEVNHSALHRLYMALRRSIDFFVGLQGCLLLGLVIPFVWMMNRIYSPGPLFYRQERIGQGGNSFDIIKFRSMMIDAEKFSGAVWAEEDDPRITKIGRFLRLTRLDEIPQFVNILKGEMSLIGPRPERPHFVELLAQEIPFYQTRHAIKPGLTGWAQVCYRYGASTKDAHIKLQYDLFYIKHQGAFLDLKVVLKTVGVVLGFKGR